MVNPSDDLLNLCRAGDFAAWGKLYRRCESVITHVAFKSGLADDEAADVIQETMLALIRSLDRFEHFDGLEGWIKTTATRASWRRRKQRSQVSEFEDDVGAPGDSLGELAEKESHAAVAAALEQLGGRCQKILTMLYRQGMSYSDVSRALEVPIGSVGPSRNRCLEQLKSLVERFIED